MMLTLVDERPGAVATFVLAHGAGGAMDTPFMTSVARGLAAEGIRVVRFEFPYMAARREGRRSGAPDRQAVLLDCFREAIAAERASPYLFIGGKSLGGRMATLIADAQSVAGVVCFGYPFHPPGKRDTLRTAHLATIRTPVLILQGERDPFGTRDEVGGYGLSSAISIEWMPDGDHSLVPRVRSGATKEGNLQQAVTAAAAFMMAGLRSIGS